MTPTVRQDPPLPFSTCEAPQPEQVRSYETQRGQFRARAIERLQNIPITSHRPLPDLNDSETQKAARSALSYFGCKDRPDPIKVWGGGVHDCLKTLSIPGVLFKRKRNPPIDDAEMHPYLLRAFKARWICQTEGLTLLHVPQCEVVDFDPTVVMEEELELYGASSHSVKTCYEWAIHDKEMEPLIKEMFRQLTIFKCQMEYADVKYDNLPITKEWRVALLDLDEADLCSADSVIGFTTSFSRMRDEGLFSLLPLKWFDEIDQLVKDWVFPQKYAALQAYMPSLREGALKRQERVEKLRTFYQSQEIVIPTQKLILAQGMKAGIFTGYNPQVALIAQWIVASLNKHLETVELISLTAGRVIILNAKQLLKPLRTNDTTLFPLISTALTVLKESRYIFESERIFNAIDPEAYFIEIIF